MVGEPLYALADRLKGHRHHRRGQDREAQVRLRRPLADRRSDADHDGHVHRGDERGQGAEHHRLVDNDVDVVEPVLQDRDADRQRHEHERPGDDEVLEVVAEIR